MLFRSLLKQHVGKETPRTLAWKNDELAMDSSKPVSGMGSAGVDITLDADGVDFGIDLDSIFFKVVVSLFFLGLVAIYVGLRLRRAWQNRQRQIRNGVGTLTVT